jgi:hypothetical protein
VIPSVALGAIIALAGCASDGSEFQSQWTDQPVSTRDTVCEALSAATPVGTLGFAPMRESEAALYRCQRPLKALAPRQRAYGLASGKRRRPTPAGMGLL